MSQVPRPGEIEGSQRPSWNAFLRIFSGLDYLFVSVVLFAAIGALRTFFAIREKPSRLKQFLPEQLAFLQTTDSYPQRVAFITFLALLLVAGIAAILFERRWRPALPSLQLCTFAMSSLFALALFVAIPNFSLHLWQSLSISIAILAVAYWNRGRPKVMWMGVAVVSLCAVAPGLLLVPIPVPNTLVSFDPHFAGVMLQGELLAGGKQFYVENTPRYGLLFPTLVALYTKLFSAPSFGNLLYAVQLFQAAFYGLFLTAAWLATRAYERGAAAFAVLVVALTLAPWVATLGFVNFYPNLSGLRFLFFPIAAICAVSLPAMINRSAGIAAGLTAATALLSNFETGIAISAGLALAWLLRMRRQTIDEAARSAAAGIACAVLVMAVYVVGFYLTMHSLPVPLSPSAAKEGTSLMSLLASGGGGLRMTFQPAVLVMLAHAGYVVVTALRAVYQRSTDGPTTQAAAIATFILVWFPYFANRAHPFNLWTFLALYALLLAPAIASSAHRLAALAVAGFLILPISMDHAHNNLIAPLTPNRWTSDWKPGCADGLHLPQDYCTNLRIKADTLKSFAAKGKVAWSTAVPMMMVRMSQVYGSLPSTYMFDLVPTVRAFKKLLETLLEKNFDYILIDDADDPLIKPQKPIDDLNLRLMDGLVPSYVLDQKTGGWLVYKRQNAGSESAVSLSGPDERVTPKP